jgi:Protein of unknown function (DUF3179)
MTVQRVALPTNGTTRQKTKGFLNMLRITGLAAGFMMIVAGVIAAPAGSADLRPGDIVTVLPKDAIPAIMSPSFDEAGKASWLRHDNVVVGMSIAGESRAYPVSILSRHEIVNDKLGGVPIAVTW